MSLDQITVRQFREDEWQLYKAVRLKALQSDPRVFGSTYERESAYTDQQWQEGVANPDVGVFGIFADGKLIGMTGVAVDKDDPSRETALLWGSWLEREWRGKGISYDMYEARIAWAKERPHFRRIVVGHREGNVASQKANQKHGFTPTEALTETWHDGKTEACYCYELRLK